MSKHETNSRFTDDMNAQKRWNNVAFSITNIDIKPTIGAIQLNTKSMAMESFIHYSLTDLHCVLFFFGLVHSFFNFRTAAWNGAKIDSALRWQVYLSRFVSSFYSLQQFTFVWDSVRITLKWVREIERESVCARHGLQIFRVICNEFPIKATNRLDSIDSNGKIWYATP